MNNYLKINKFLKECSLKNKIIHIERLNKNILNDFKKFELFKK